MLSVEILLYKKAKDFFIKCQRLTNADRLTSGSGKNAFVEKKQNVFTSNPLVQHRAKKKLFVGFELIVFIYFHIFFG